MIVTRLSPLDLKAHLQVSTAEIDTQDHRGWAPLIWAVRRSDVDAMQILLSFGASEDIVDYTKQSVFHMLMNAIRNRMVMLEALLSALASTPESNLKILDQISAEGPTTFAIAACYNHVSEAELLLSCGATVGLSYDLLFATRHNSHEMLELLLRSSINTSIKDEERQFVAHVAGSLGDLRTINILNDWGISDPCPEDRDTFGHTPLKNFDIDKPDLVDEDEATRLECREAFLRLLDSMARNGSKPFVGSIKVVEEETQVSTSSTDQT